jgi:NTP pyrophosphatase (non-canonical NTP hydrolase)
MDMSYYQEECKKTAIYSKDIGLFYAALGLAGEAGEIANAVKKVLRDDSGVLTEKARKNLAKELGDVLWYVSAVATELGVELNSVAHDNIKKLFDRLERGVIAGSGDNR